MQEWGDKSIELYQFEARMYDPALGRWHAPDPLEQFHSPYLANFNNPANFVDPDGRSGKFWQIVGHITTSIMAYFNVDFSSGTALTGTMDVGATAAGTLMIGLKLTSIYMSIQDLFGKHHMSIEAQAQSTTAGAGVGSSNRTIYPLNPVSSAMSTEPALESLDNVIYIIVTKEGKRALKKLGTSGKMIADQINENMKLKGLTTRAVYWEGNPEDFDVNKMGKKSSLAVIGADRNDVSDFYRKEIDSWFADMYLDNPKNFWQGGASNPERAQNFKHTTKAGEAKFIAIDGSALSWFGESMSAGKYRINSTQAGAFLAMHGLGHNADMNCTSGGNETIFSSIMKDPTYLQVKVAEGGYRGIFLPETVNGSDPYIEAIKKRFYVKN
jgi:RHS repeat-associated protein